MKRITLVLLILLSTWHVGELSARDLSIWQLYKYKSTELLRIAPFCWCPYKSYLVTNQYVTVEAKDNQSTLVINADIIKMVKADADYNKSHAHKYKGKPKTRLKKIYRYCKRTEYVAHVKTAREVFQKRQGDCAGVSSAFYVLCKKNHIPVRYVIGWTETDCHAWNRVKIGKRWYWIDCTQGKWISRKLWKGYSVMEMW